MLGHVYNPRGPAPIESSLFVAAAKKEPACKWSKQMTRRTREESKNDNDGPWVLDVVEHVNAFRRPIPLQICCRLATFCY